MQKDKTGIQLITSIKNLYGGNDRFDIGITQISGIATYDGGSGIDELTDLGGNTLPNGIATTEVEVS